MGGNFQLTSDVYSDENDVFRSPTRINKHFISEVKHFVERHFIGLDAVKNVVKISNIKGMYTWTWYGLTAVNVYSDVNDCLSIFLRTTQPSSHAKT